MIEDILRFLSYESQPSEIKAVLSNQELYETPILHHENFKKLERKEKREIWAIDGSNKTVLEGSGVAIEFGRVVAVSSKGRILETSFLSVVKPKIKDEQLYYDVMPYHWSGIEIGLKMQEFNAYDETLTGSAFKAKPATVAAITRRFMEWAMIKHVINNYNEVIVLKDGSLHMGVTGEKEVVGEVFKEAKEKGGDIIGIVKFSNILSNRGKDILNEINDLANIKAPWLYAPIAIGKRDLHPAVIGALKTHNHGRIIRIEMHKDFFDISALEEIIGLCNDALYLGYPYLLAKADKVAKVKDYEIKDLKKIIINKISKELKGEIYEDLHDDFKKEM